MSYDDVKKAIEILLKEIETNPSPRNFETLGALHKKLLEAVKTGKTDKKDDI